MYATFTADTGSTTANSLTDSLTVTGGTDITTSIVGDVLTVNFSGTIPTTVNGLTDTNFTGIAQGNSFYWNGSAIGFPLPKSNDLVGVNANGNADYTFAGPGFTGTVADPTLYVYRGFTYAFDNSSNGGGHPFRIQTTQGLSELRIQQGQLVVDLISYIGRFLWTLPTHCIISARFTHNARNNHRCKLINGKNSTWIWCQIEPIFDEIFRCSRSKSFRRWIWL